MIKTFTLLLLILKFTCATTSEYKIGQVITFGAILNWNFGKRTESNSYGFHVSLWEMSPFENEKGLINIPVPYGVKLGIEIFKFQKIYSMEAQSGFGIAGASLGMIYSNKLKFGFQSSVWANYIAGVKMGYRYLKGNRFNPGIYVAVPIYMSGIYEELN